MPGGKSDTIIAGLAMIIAAIALVTSVCQGNAQRQHNELSVRPVLFFDTHSAADGTLLTIDLKNGGTGPAIIKQFTLYVDGNAVQAPDKDVWKKAEKELGIENENIPFVVSSHDEGDAMAVNETHYILQMEPDAYKNLADPLKELWKKAVPKIKVKINYESIYGEKFEVQYPAAK